MPVRAAICSPFQSTAHQSRLPAHPSNPRHSALSLRQSARLQDPWYPIYLHVGYPYRYGMVQPTQWWPPFQAARCPHLPCRFLNIIFICMQDLPAVRAGPCTAKAHPPPTSSSSSSRNTLGPLSRSQSSGPVCCEGSSSSSDADMPQRLKDYLMGHRAAGSSSQGFTPSASNSPSPFHVRNRPRVLGQTHRDTSCLTPTKLYLTSLLLQLASQLQLVVVRPLATEKYESTCILMPCSYSQLAHGLGQQYLLLLSHAISSSPWGSG